VSATVRRKRDAASDAVDSEPEKASTLSVRVSAKIDGIECALECRNAELIRVVDMISSLS